MDNVEEDTFFKPKIRWVFTSCFKGANDTIGAKFLLFGSLESRQLVPRSLSKQNVPFRCPAFEFGAECRFCLGMNTSTKCCLSRDAARYMSISQNCPLQLVIKP